MGGILDAKKNNMRLDWYVEMWSKELQIVVSVSQKERRKHDLASIHFSEPVCKWDGYWGQLDWKEGKKKRIHFEEMEKKRLSATTVYSVSLVKDVKKEYQNHCRW